jgi:hypothetical protein
MGVFLADIQSARSDDATPTFSLPPLDEFWAIVERPLFTRGRRLSEPEAEPAPVVDSSAGTETPHQLVLVGTATDQASRAVAVLRDTAAGTDFRVWVGDPIGRWSVKAIGPRAVTLASEDTEVSVTLDEPVVPEGPAPPEQP